MSGSSNTIIYLEHSGIKGTVEYSEEDEIFYGRLLDIGAHLFSYEGYTLKDLKEDFKLAVQEYLVSVEEHEKDN